jgi:hypothetical protein
LGGKPDVRALSAKTPMDPGLKLRGTHIDLDGGSWPAKPLPPTRFASAQRPAARALQATPLRTQFVCVPRAVSGVHRGRCGKGSGIGLCGAGCVGGRCGEGAGIGFCGAGCVGGQCGEGAVIGLRGAGGVGGPMWGRRCHRASWRRRCGRADVGKPRSHTSSASQP